MARKVEEVLKSGYLTKAERRAIDFEEALEENEEHMGEGAAMALTCERFKIDHGDYPYILIEIPDGDWWTVKHLPVRGRR